MRQVVTFTANDRPHYLEQTRESWQQVRGIEDAHVIFRVEPGNPLVEQVAEEFPGRLLEVHTNPQRYGALGNPWHAMELAFSFDATRFAILAEDDSLVADDVLEWFNWAEQVYSNRRDVLAVCAFQHDEQGPANQAIVSKRFVPTIWGTWRDRWAVLREDWDFDYSHNGWDWRIMQHYLRDGPWWIVAPCRSRSQVSGEFGGTHLQPGAQYQEHLSTCFSAHYDPQQFEERP